MRLGMMTIYVSDVQRGLPLLHGSPRLRRQGVYARRGGCGHRVHEGLFRPGDRPGASRRPIARLQQEQAFEEGQSGVLFLVDDLEREHARLRRLGVEFVRPPAKTEAGFAAMIDDTCGNLIQLLQPGPPAWASVGDEA